MKQLSKGFTIVELAVIISIIGLLAAATVVGFTNWQPLISKNTVKSDLLAASTGLTTAKNFSNGYPATLPSTITATPGVVLEMANAGPGKFCVNGYHTRYPDVRLSIHSSDKAKVRDYLCGGSPNGSIIGGSIPSTPVGTNIAQPLSEWTLNGAASLDASTGEVTLGTNSTVVSPLIRVNNNTGISFSAQFYTDTQSGFAAFQPNGGYVTSAHYYGADGVTPVNGSGGLPSNGCARAVPRGSWNAGTPGTCGYSLGPNVSYVKITLTGRSAASSYASSDLKLKNVSLVLY